MEIKKEKQIENLVRDGVIIATQEILVRDGEEPQNVGGVVREAYGNWESDRERLMKNEPKEVVVAVLAIWGDTPTVADAPKTTVQDEVTEKE